MSFQGRLKQKIGQARRHSEAPKETPGIRTAFDTEERPLGDKRTKTVRTERQICLTDSFCRTQANPDKEGWLDYRVNQFWHKEYFRLHSHYLSYYRDETQTIVGGMVDLWNVQDMVLDNNEMRLTLNERALRRASSKNIINRGPAQAFRVRARTPQEAKEWLERMRRSALVGSPSGDSVDFSERLDDQQSSPMVDEWKFDRIRLQHMNGAVLHTIKSVVSDAYHTRLLLGSRLDPELPMKVQVTLCGPGWEQAHGVTTIDLSAGHGELEAAVSLPTGGPLVARLGWQAEPTSDGLSAGDLLMQHRYHFIIPLAALLISPFLFFLSFAAVGYWVFQSNSKNSPGLVDCFVVHLALNASQADLLSARSQAQSTSPLSPQASSDKSITDVEMAKLVKLRKELEDLKASGSGVSAAVFDKHVNVDYRLVRFVRARPTITAAAEMVRTSLRWRTESGADDIVRTWQPPDWMLEYFAASCFVDCIRQQKDRLGCYQRDKDGHLSAYWRGGFVNYKDAFIAAKGDLDLIHKFIIWTFELLREDADLLHEQTNGGVPSYFTLVYDLEGYVFSNQMPVGSLLAIAQRMFNLINVNYPEFIHRILIIRAPWLFYSLWSVFKPLIPQDLLDKMPLTAGGDVKKVVQNITPTFSEDQIPQYVGGRLTDADGNPECLYLIGPRGPFLPDKGQAIFQKANK